MSIIEAATSLNSERSPVSEEALGHLCTDPSLLEERHYDEVDLLHSHSDSEETGDMSERSSVSGVRYFKRNESEGSVDSCSLSTPMIKEADEPSSYWTINNDFDEESVDAACEADEESIASSIKDTSKFKFLKNRNISESTASTTKRSSSSHRRFSESTAPGRTQLNGRSPSSTPSEVSRQTSIVTTSEMTLDDKKLTLTVVKEKLTMDAALPMLNETVAALGTTVNYYNLDRLTQLFRDVLARYQRLPFLRVRLLSIAVLLVCYLVLPKFLAGVLLGIYLAFVAFLFVCISEPLTITNGNGNKEGTNQDQVIADVKEHSIMEEKRPTVYKGWMNILNAPYSPHTFRVNEVQTVLVRLDGNMLRISRPDRALLKHAFHDDPTLTRKEPSMMAQSIYDLTNASVKLRPRRLARRRWFSRRYPICIKLYSPDSEIHSRNEHRFLLSQSKTLNNMQSQNNEESKGPLSKLFRRKKRSRKPSGGSQTSTHSNTLPEIMETKVHEADGSPNLADRVTVGGVELGHEADGYASDMESEDTDSSLGMQKSYSAENLNRLPLIRLQKNFPGASSRASRTIFLFARSAREKERWFHLLRKACNKYSQPATRNNFRKMSLPTLNTFSSHGMTQDYFRYLLHHIQFTQHLEGIMTPTIDQRSSESVNEYGTVNMDLGRIKWTEPVRQQSQEFVIVANLLASRIFYDFCRDEYWCNAVKHKIQTKLASIHLPYFIDALELSKFDIGTAIPRINRIYAPTVDDWGTWIDLNIKYEGCIRLGLETKVNLMKLKGNPDHINTAAKDGAINTTQLLSVRGPSSRYSDDEIPESPETSPDEEFWTKMKPHEPVSVKEKTGKKILSFVDKIAHSKYFKEASELKPVKKVMEEISSTRLMLNVEVTALEGTLAINIAPPPSDRLWYGFRKPPQMSVKAVPQVGDRSVFFSTVSDWIESKIQLVMEKNLVMPNMDDIVIPVLSGNDLLVGPLNN